MPFCAHCARPRRLLSLLASSLFPSVYNFCRLLPYSFNHRNHFSFRFLSSPFLQWKKMNQISIRYKRATLYFEQYYFEQGSGEFHLFFFLYWRLNSGPCACETGGRTTELNPQPCSCFRGAVTLARSFTRAGGSACRLAAGQHLQRCGLLCVIGSAHSVPVRGIVKTSRPDFSSVLLRRPTWFSHRKGPACFLLEVLRIVPFFQFIESQTKRISRQVRL